MVRRRPSNHNRAPPAEFRAVGSGRRNTRRAVKPNMKVITPGHKYELENFEKLEQTGQVLQFIEKRPASEPVPFPNALETANDGTTNEEVLAVLIDRLNYLQGKFPCRENAIVITKLEESL